MEFAAQDLFNKLIMIRKKLDYMKRDTEGVHRNKYVPESHILAVIRPIMDEQGIWLDQEVVAMESLESGGVRVCYKYHFTDIETGICISRTQYLEETQTGAQKIGGLMTYGMRYFLYRFFCIPMDNLDPEQQEENVKKSVKSLQDSPISAKQAEELTKLIGKDEVLMNRMMAWAFDEDWKDKGMSCKDITVKDYPKIITAVKRLVKK